MPCSPVRPSPASAYFISQGEPVNCWQWIDEILALAGLPPVSGRFRCERPGGWARRWKRSIGVLRLRGEPRMTRFLAAQLGTSHYFDIRRARRDFGYAAHDFDRRGHAAAGRSAGVVGRGS